MKPALHADTKECRAVSDMLARVGDKWTVLVITYLSDGPMRFSELRRTIGNISQKMLTMTLRSLERDGFVTRTVTPSIPPRVDYELTELGRELQVPVKALGDWARANIDRVWEARQRFDEMDRAPSAQPSAPQEPASQPRIRVGV